VHEKRLEIRWSDLDAFGHVHNAAYLVYLEECRDEWLESVLRETGTSSDFVIARVAIDYRRELRLEDEAVVVTCRLERLGTSSLTTREEIHTGGDLAAEAEAVLVPRGGDGRSRPLSAAERVALEAEA
jgi:acyl-CoA thioester hydrolase